MEREGGDPQRIGEILEALLSDPAAGWSIGTWGAVADFERGLDAPFTQAGGEFWTSGGGVRVTIHEGMRAIPYERCVRGPGRWRQALAVCLPDDAARMHGRAVVSELGPDREAIRSEDRSAILFDLGLGAKYCDFLVRTHDARVVAVLRAALGRSIWDHELGLAAELAVLAPDRVVLTRGFRAEVTSPIPRSGEETVFGPHTHLLPKLLATGRTHPAIEPIPAGLVPVATFFPAHPLVDPPLQSIRFDADRHDRFQALLRSYGDREHLVVKDIVASGVREGRPAEPLGSGRGAIAHSRAARVTLRQLAITDPDAPGLGAWSSAFGEAPEPSRALPENGCGQGSNVIC